METPHRLAAPPHAGYAHPNAVRQAQALEAHGYTEVGIDDLDDGEDVVVISLATGGLLLVRYHRVGNVPDEHGRRAEHVFEAWPGSPFSDEIAYADTLRTTREGERVARMAIFRPSEPEHAQHGPLLYDARARKASVGKQ
jgi:hypothetical protein